MKRIGVFLTFVLILIISSACSNGNDTAAQNNNSNQKAEAGTSNSDSGQKQVSVQPGLGDTVDSFIKEYGENKGNAQLGRFKEDYLLPIFMNNRVVDLTLQFKATDQPIRTMDEAKKIAAKFIPKDALLANESTTQGNMTKKELQYSSKTLAELFPDFKPVGKFLIIFTYNEGNEDEVTTVNIALGEMP